MYKEIEGDLISLGKEGYFDVVVHGCNCFCTMQAGIAPQMAKAFGCDRFYLETPSKKGDIDKLGQIDFKNLYLEDNGRWYESINKFPTYKRGTISLYVVNAYTQYNYGKNHFNGTTSPLDYEALTLCLRKINHIFKGKHIGLPQIGCGLGGGLWDIDLEEYPQYSLVRRGVKQIIKQELKDCLTTVVIFNK